MNEADDKLMKNDDIFADVFLKDVCLLKCAGTGHIRCNSSIACTLEFPSSTTSQPRG